MPYTAEISRSNRGCFLFLIDQSGSMTDRLEAGTKADEVATVLNRLLQELIIRCSKEEGVRDYFDVGVIGYGGTGAINALAGPLGQQLLHPISALDAHPTRVEDRVRKVPDGAGGLVEVQTKFPVWFDPRADGGTPMCAALNLAGQTLIDWCEAHPASFPPVVLNLTDGESTDGDPEIFAEQLRQIATDDGEAILYNAHITRLPQAPIAFPDSEGVLPDQFARLLFRMSSPLVGGTLEAARREGYRVGERSRGYMYNVKTEQVIQFFDIGTRAANLR